MSEYIVVAKTICMISGILPEFSVGCKIKIGGVSGGLSILYRFLTAKKKKKVGGIVKNLSGILMSRLVGTGSVVPELCSNMCFINRISLPWKR